MPDRDQCAKNKALTKAKKTVLAEAWIGMGL